MACTQEKFEGVFIPMKSPWIIDGKDIVRLTEERRLYDYHGDDSECELEWESYNEVWQKMMDRFQLNVKEIEDTERIPDGYPKHGTSHEWVEVTGKRDDMRLYEFDWEELVGEVVALLYPNVD